MKLKKKKYEKDIVKEIPEEQAIKNTRRSDDDRKRLEKWQIGRRRFS